MTSIIETMTFKIHRARVHNQLHYAMKSSFMKVMTDSSVSNEFRLTSNGNFFSSSRQSSTHSHFADTGSFVIRTTEVRFIPLNLSTAIRTVAATRMSLENLKY